MDNKIYDAIMDDEGFLNDIWATIDMTTKIEILEKMGWNLDAEWLKTHKLEKLTVEEEMDDDS